MRVSKTYRPEILQMKPNREMIREPAKDMKEWKPANMWLSGVWVLIEGEIKE
jgi:hypothetical protein